jgi:ribA/ribD-fused uncharacterized protein
MKNIKELKKRISSGEVFEYELFWHGPFSQWESSSFTVDSVCYKTAEHWMMAKKAELFNDLNTRDKIIKAPTPKIAKALGREVKNFNEEKWVNKRYHIVYDGNLHKFKSNSNLLNLLLATKEKVLVEASPVDCIWGIGLSSDSPDAVNPYKWKGLNILGFVLTELKNNLNGNKSGNKM